MISLIDGDIVLHRCGFASEGESEQIAVSRVERMIDDILEKTQATEYMIFVSDTRDNNFRTKLFTAYKANRAAKPTHYPALKSFMFERYMCEVSRGMEADDSLGIELTRHGEKAILCSYDKDLWQVPGHHYSIGKQDFKFIEEDEANFNFFKQLLMGDKTDNIIGIYGMGPAKAAKALGSMTDPFEMWSVARGFYEDDDRLFLNAQLLWVLRKPNEYFQIPRPVCV